VKSICPIFQIDAFSREPFKGNPAAVCLLNVPAEAQWMQAVAGEMNLSETAFVCRSGLNEEYELRWFTPRTEVDLCGHATLAAAHALWESGWLKSTQLARFQTRSGVLVCAKKGDWIEMDFPARPIQPATPPPGLLEALGVKPVAIARTAFDYLIQLESESVVREVRPDFRLLSQTQTRGVMVTSRADDTAYQFVSRFFAPAVGIDEDPVTGSAHCALAVYWQAILHRSDFLARQISARGGVIRLELQGDRVTLAGQAVTVLHGELLTSSGDEM
jgi:PhzF family phenazine biosynthesis protein